MKSTTLNVSFYCRPCKADKKGRAPVELSLIINGERAIITLPRKEYPEVFKKQMAMKKQIQPKSTSRQQRADSMLLSLR